MVNDLFHLQIHGCSLWKFMFYFSSLTCPVTRSTIFLMDFFFNLIVLGVTTDFTHKNGHSLWNLLVVECFQFSCLTIQVIWFYMISLTKSLIRPVIWHLFYLQKMVVPYGISYHLFYLRKRWLTIFTVALGTFSSV